MNKQQEQIKFETVEDMVKYISQRHYETTKKWKLCMQSHNVWIDEKAGAEWQAADSANRYPYSALPDSKEYKDYIKEEARLQSSRPAEKKVFEYYLFSEGGWRGNYIYLSDTLYNQLDKVWTKSPIWRHSDQMENKARLTIPGMLKRLGNTEVGEKIKAAKDAQKKAQEKQSRNNARKQIRETSTKLYELLASNNVVDWDTSNDGKDTHFFARLSTLTKLIDEE